MKNIFPETCTIIRNKDSLFSFLESVDSQLNTKYTKCINPPNDKGLETLEKIKKCNQEMNKLGFKPSDNILWMNPNKPESAEKELNRKQRVTDFDKEHKCQINHYYNRILVYSKNGKYYGTKLIRYNSINMELIYIHEEKYVVINNLKKNNYTSIYIDYYKDNEDPNKPPKWKSRIFK